MKAAVCTGYGSPDVLKIKDVPIPAPAPDEVLIRVHASAVNSADLRLRKGEPFALRLFFGLFRPKFPVLGGVLSGTVVQTGSRVKRFKAGDEVFGSCALKYGFGAYAEFKCLPETAVLTHKPGLLSHDQAAALPFGGLTALHFINKAGIKQGMNVLIYGASGSVGSMALQICRSLGARVTAVGSPDKQSFLKESGADVVHDYVSLNPREMEGNYDVVMDTSGKLNVYSGLKWLNEEGRLILVSAGLKDMLKACLIRRKGKKILFGLIRETIENISTIAELAYNQKVSAVIDKKFSLYQVSEAHRYAESGTKKGNVVVVIPLTGPGRDI